jgi:hypothetical protein
MVSEINKAMTYSAFVCFYAAASAMVFSTLLLLKMISYLIEKAAYRCTKKEHVSSSKAS